MLARTAVCAMAALVLAACGRTGPAGTVITAFPDAVVDVTIDVTTVDRVVRDVPIEATSDTATDTPIAIDVIVPSNDAPFSCDTGTIHGPPPMETGACSGGTENCNGVCVDLSTDPQNCGGCGTICLPGGFCSGGTCGCGCSSGQTCCTVDCTLRCVSLIFDTSNCGECGHACNAGEFCVEGACIGPRDGG